jgi:hypothetical protein
MRLIFSSALRSTPMNSGSANVQVETLRPADAPVGQQAPVELTGEQRDAVHPGVLAEPVAGEADFAAAAGHQHLLV